MTTEDKHAETTGLGFTIPAEGVKFRLRARESKHVIYSRPDGEHLVWHYLGPKHNDQIFTLLHGKDEYEGMYAIKSWYCGKVIYSRTTRNPHIGNISGDGRYPDNWFQFPPDASDKSSFRIYSPISDTVIVSRTTRKPHFDNFRGDDYQDQLWYFQLVQSD